MHKYSQWIDLIIAANQNRHENENENILFELANDD